MIKATTKNGERTIIREINADAARDMVEAELVLMLRPLAGYCIVTPQAPILLPFGKVPVVFNFRMA